MFDAPAFNDPLSSEVAGDDPLGLAPTNERLYGDVFPGINNVVRYVRVYAAMCWMAWRLELHLQANPKGLTTQAFSDAMQKMELIVCLVNQNKGYTQVAGITRRASNDQPRKLVFQSFGSSTASLMEAVAYRPSLTNGLRLLEPKLLGTFRCTPAGLALAEAMDARLRRCSGYEWLCDIENIVAKPSAALQFEEALELGCPSIPEQNAFAARFFPGENEQDIEQADVNRALAIRLVLRCVDAVCRSQSRAGGEPWTDEDEVRACMARGRAPGGEVIDLSDVVECQATWAVLQIRQLQRLALDALYCIVEAWLDANASSDADTSIKACAEAVGVLTTGGLSEGFHDSVRQCVEHIQDLQGSSSTLFEAACDSPDDDEVDIFKHIDELRQADFVLDSDGNCPAAASAYVALIACSVEVGNLMNHGAAKAVLRRDRDGCSLLSWMALVSQWADRSPTQFIAHVVTHWVVLRHFQVVADRSRGGDGKNRFRFVVGDHGLERFDSTLGLPTPSVAQDRLRHAMLLSEQCGLLEQRDGRYRLSPSGRLRMC